MVWVKAHHFTLSVYQMTHDFPDDEQFGLTAQMRRNATSIPTNTAEGCGPNGDRRLVRFMSIAAGSASEVEYQLFLAYELKYIQDKQYGQLNTLVNEMKRM